MASDASVQNWYRDNYLVSTDRRLLDLEAINDAFGSDLMFWTKRLAPARLQKLVDSSLCLGLYALPESTAEIAGKITDRGQVVGAKHSHTAGQGNLARLW